MTLLRCKVMTNIGNCEASSKSTTLAGAPDELSMVCFMYDTLHFNGKSWFDNPSIAIEQEGDTKAWHQVANVGDSPIYISDNLLALLMFDIF